MSVIYFVTSYFIHIKRNLFINNNKIKKKIVSKLLGLAEVAGQSHETKNVRCANLLADL